MDLKRRILSTSLLLFNTHGYKHVTVRMIAQELQISSGHLNYHFKKRIHIFEALYEEMMLSFEERIKEVPKSESNLQRLKYGFEHSTRWMVDYKFFWTDLYNLVPLSQKVQEHFKSVYQNRVNGYNVVIQALCDRRMMSEIKNINEKTLLIKNLIDRGNTWLYSAELYGESVDAKLLNEQINRLALPLLPHLTRKGKKEFYAVFRI